MTTFLLLRGDSSLVFLHPSPPSIASTAVGGLCLQPTTIRFGLRRTHRGRHGLRKSPCCRDGRRPADSSKGVLHRRRTRSRPRARPRLPLPRLALRRPDGEAVGAASPPGHAGVQQQQLVLQPPAVDYGFGPGGAPRPSARRANTPPRVPRPRPGPPTAVTPAPAASPVPTVPIPSDRVGAEPVGTPILRLNRRAFFHMPIGSENSRLSRRATPQCVCLLYTSPSPRD